MNIGITLSPQAYTPEAYAYRDFLQAAGHAVELAATPDPDHDIHIRFMGFAPFWRRPSGRARVVHEYQSLSAPPYARLKDLIKSGCNHTPHGRIFLNAAVRAHLHFAVARPQIYRDMGIAAAFFQSPDATPEFDLVYAGSVAGRTGLVATLRRLAQNNRILLIGHVDPADRAALAHPHITQTGKVAYADIPALYRRARFGLNYTPDVYPFRLQTSTKTLEYLASGLGVLSNPYRWIKDFARRHACPLQWLPEEAAAQTRLELAALPLPSVRPDMAAYRWDTVLQRCGFLDFLQNLD